MTDVKMETAAIQRARDYREGLGAKRAAEREQAAQLVSAMSPEEVALHTEIATLRGMGMVCDEVGRELFVTPFNGCYGIAGSVVTLNGSPPRFLAVVTDVRYPDAQVTVLAPWRRTPLVIGRDRPAKWQGLRKALLDYIAWRTA